MSCGIRQNQQAAVHFRTRPGALFKIVLSVSPQAANVTSEFPDGFFRPALIGAWVGWFVNPTEVSSSHSTPRFKQNTTTHPYAVRSFFVIHSSKPGHHYLRILLQSFQYCVLHIRTKVELRPDHLWHRTRLRSYSAVGVNWRAWSSNGSRGNRKFAVIYLWQVSYA